MKSIKISLIFWLLASASLQAQTFSIGGQLGYSSPKGDAFTDPVTKEKQSSFGLGFTFDALYHLEDFDNRVAVGIMYDANALFGKNSSDAFDIGIYGLSLYGIKGQFRLKEPEYVTFSPYAGLGLGLSQFSTPDVTYTDASGNESTTYGKTVSSFGIRPEFGIDIEGFLLSVAYFIPMEYTVESNTGSFDGTAGVLTFALGYRYYLDI
tara:strand:- start:285 stop:908 length:624 start_codon:yes stop_codon:yes gene_type:complete